MGPKTSAEIQALNKLSTKDLTTYVELWRQKHANARDQALLELAPMQAKVTEMTKKLETQAAIDLKTYKDVWVNAMADIKKGVENEFYLLLQYIPKDVTNAKPVIVNSLDSIGKAISSAFAPSKWDGTGKNIVLGISGGIKSMSAKLAEEAAKTAAKALAAANKRLGIKSPSREFAKVGMYSVLGMVDGLQSYSGLVANAGANTGDVAVNSLKGAVSNIADVITNGMNVDPTIRPVLDLTDVENGLTSIFANTQTLSVASVADKASSMVRPGGTAAGIGSTTQTNNNVSAPIQIIYQPTVRNDNDINKINRGLKNIVDRYAYAKGVPVV